MLRRPPIMGVCMALVSTGRSNPSLDEAGKTSFLLHRQFRRYTTNNPAPKPQKAIPLKLLQEMVQRPCSDPGLIEYHQLTIPAFFFTMRSCEYLKTTGERRTQSLRLHNLVVHRKNKIVPHDDPQLELADTVTVTFKYQKSCLLYTSPSPRDGLLSRMPSSA